MSYNHIDSEAIKLLIAQNFQSIEFNNKFAVLVGVSILSFLPWYF